MSDTNSLKPVDANDFVHGAEQFFKDLDQWPDVSVMAMIRHLSEVKSESELDIPLYYGVQGILVMLVTGNKGQWPPITPQHFASQIAREDPIHLIRYAKNVMTYELKKEHGRL